MSAGMPPPPAMPPPPDPSGLPSGPARQRPGTVTVANLCLMLVALLSVVYLALAIMVTPAMVDAMEEVFAGTEAEDVAGFFGYMVLIGAVVNLVFGIAYAILAIFNNQGRNGARITTWVLGGIGLCCAGVGLVTEAAGATFGTGDQAGMPSQSEIEDIVARHVPDWFDATSLAVSVVALVALAAALLLLALPPSNAFFRKQPEPFVPPPGSYPPPPGSYPPPPGVG